MDEKKMNLIEKIGVLNKACNESLSFLAGSGHWSLHSYKAGTPFYMSPWIQAESFEEVINKALEHLFDQGAY